MGFTTTGSAGASKFALMPSSGSKADEEEEALLDEEDELEEELLDDEELEDELLVEELEEVEAAELVELFDGAGVEPPPPPEPQPATSVKITMATRFLTALRLLATGFQPLQDF